MKPVYLIAAIVGTIVPYVFFFAFFSQNGFALSAFVHALFVNGAAGGFSADLLISSFVFWYWSYRDAKKRNIKNWWLIPVTNLSVGLSLSLPLYFYLREGSHAPEPA